MRLARSPESVESTDQAMLLEQGLAALGIVLTAAAQARLLDYAACWANGTGPTA
ncbi:hypothetical protein [Propionivibrio sp.]|uniref:hypothetical protein n=1 Tax=Propionivibrio sp. TaxID=2212460 RepID=UPI00345D6CED